MFVICYVVAYVTPGMKLHDMFHCLGLIANVAYIAMCKTAMQPLVCVQHADLTDHGYVPSCFQEILKQ